MSKQRSTQSTSGRGSESNPVSAAPATANQDRTQYTGQGGKQSTAQSGGAAKQKGDELGQPQQKATQQIDSGLAKGKAQAAETLNTVAETLVVSGQQLQQRNQERIARFVDQTANKVQRVSKYLQNTDVSEMVQKTEEFARRRPALFLSGTFVLGILGARFLKSSRRNQEQRAAGAGYSGTRSGQGYSRGRGTAVEREVSSRPQDEWAAAGKNVPAFGDVADPRSQTQPVGDPGFGRGKSPIEYGDRHGGPDTPSRL
jgi:hypothetical protein